jgi:hypothetical protein
MTKIDCLVCHDTTGTYKKTPTAAGMPDPKVDLVATWPKTWGHLPQDLRRLPLQRRRRRSGQARRSLPSAAASGAQLRRPHGRVRFSVHRLPPHPQPQDRRSQLIGAGGGRQPVLLQGCHSDTPHYGDGLLDHHLNKHSDNIACTTCHAPVYAKCKPTKTFWDWSKAGDKTASRKKTNTAWGTTTGKKASSSGRSRPSRCTDGTAALQSGSSWEIRLDMDAEGDQTSPNRWDPSTIPIQDIAVQDHGGRPGRGRPV